MLKAILRSSFTLVAGLATLPADADNIYYENAQVLSAAPQTERVNNPHQECHTEYPSTSEAEPRERSIAGAIIGGVAGGLLGAQVGKGSGRVAASAVGAATGAIVGDRVDNRDNQQPRAAERCVMVDNWETVVRGYLVTYRYDGRVYTATLQRDPGSTLAVRIAVEPAQVNAVSALEPERSPRH